MHSLFQIKLISDQKGAVAITVGICMFMLIGFAALSIDIGHLLVARNELQNAADAGALAGARFLYNDEGTAVNPNANQIAYETATANMSEKTAVEVNWTSGNTGDVERGHFCFSTGEFTANDSLEPVELWDVSESELDMNMDFINAVRVVARRQTTPVTAFFAGIFGRNSFEASAEAVAYIGFAGTLEPHDVDQPIVICSGALQINGGYSCGIGRMINSGNNLETNETGGWTSYEQENPCSGGTNASEMNGLICAEGNPEPINMDQFIATNGGEIQSAFKSLYDCWVDNTDKTAPWQITLPVVGCPGNNITTCQEPAGSVTLNIIWINDQTDPQYNNVPQQMNYPYEAADGTQMPSWSADPQVDGQTNWQSFAEAYKLQNQDGSPAPYAQKSIYFLPDCEPHEPRGATGGHNFGILAKYPVLVK